MAIKEFEDFLVKKPAQKTEPRQEIDDLSEFRVAKPYTVRSREEAAFNPNDYSPPSPDDPFFDSAKQALLGSAVGGVGAAGNILSLLERGVQWGASKLGISDDALERARQFSRNFTTSPLTLPSTIMGLPTSRTIEDLAQQSGINTEPQTAPGRIARTIAEAVSGTAALGVGGVGLGAAGAGAATGQVLRELGLPESLATTADIGISLNPRQLYRNIVRPRVTSSGLPIRPFQRSTGYTKLSSQAKKRLDQNLEKEFRNLSDRILDSSESVQQIRNNPNYREGLQKAFQQVEELASTLDVDINTKEIGHIFQKKIQERPYRGYADSEFESILKREQAKIARSLRKEQNISAQTGVSQFRKNNQQLSEYFEPGKSNAYNRAKKVALLEHNQAIEEVF